MLLRERRWVGGTPGSCQAPWCLRGGGAVVPASQACLNGGKGLWLLVAGDRSREGGVPGEEERLVDMGSWRCPVAAW